MGKPQKIINKLIFYVFLYYIFFTLKIYAPIKVVSIPNVYTKEKEPTAIQQKAIKVYFPSIHPSNDPHRFIRTCPS